MTDEQKEKILEYARLAGEFLQKNDANIRAQLHAIEQELEMNHRQIMERAIEYTDLFRR